MIARLLVLTLVTAFSLSASAASSTAEQGEKGLQKMKQMLACGEAEGAKHISLTVVMSLGAAFSKSVEQDLQPYLAAIERAQSCSDFTSAYKILAEAFEKTVGTSAEKYFETPEGKKGLEDLIQELRKLNNQKN